MSDDTTLDEFGGNNDMSAHLELGPIKINIPSDWNSAKLRDVFDIISGNNYTGDYLSEDDNGGKIFLTLKSVSKGGGFNWDSIKYYTGEVNKREIVESGDLLIANTDVTQKGDVVGYSIQVPDFNEEREVAASMDLSILRSKVDIVNISYIKYLLQTEYIHSRMRAFSAGSTVLHLNTDLVQRLSLPLPTLSEQRKIASILHTVDQAIQKTEDIIHRLQKTLTGTRRDIMRIGTRGHQMSNSDSRFGEIPETWKTEALGSIADVTGGSTPSTDEPIYWDGEIPWATPTDLTGLNGITISTTESYITEEGLSSASTNLLPPQSVLMTSRATIGECAVNTVEMATNQGFQSLVPHDGIDTWYLYYRMEEEANYLNSLGSGSTFSEVSNTTVQRVKIPIPPVDEQKEIANVLKSIDETIIKEKEYKSQLQRFKQGLMQDLLSGEVRTDDVNIDIPEEVAKYG
jgi:type I restriction enzyme S subunit